MSASTIITTYLSEGTHAARPAAPALPAGGLAIYYETDTHNTFLYDLSTTAWVQVGGGAVLATNPMFFGNGQDGNVVIAAGSTFLSRDMYYNNLTITGGQLVTRGWRVFVSGILDLSTAPANAIVCGAIVSATQTGSNSVGTSGAAGGNDTTSNTVGNTGFGGGNGGAGGTGVGAQGTTGSGGITNGVGGASGAGGAGGASTNAGGASRAATTPQANIVFDRLSVELWQQAAGAINRIGAGAGGAGGSAGGGDGTNAGGGSGGGGGGAGTLFVSANTIKRGAGMAARTMSATGNNNGGNGGNGAAGNAAGGGGGGGGGGGWVYLIYGTLTGAAAANWLDASGGNGGNGGNGVGTGAGGVGGASGQGGRIDAWNTTAGTVTTLLPAATTSQAGGAATGTVGGTGGVAQTQAMTL